MSKDDDAEAQKSRKKAERDTRLAKNLRDNLRRRKAVGRKLKECPPVTLAPESP